MNQIGTALKIVKLTTMPDKSGWTESSRDGVWSTQKDHKNSSQFTLLLPLPGPRPNNNRSSLRS